MATHPNLVKRKIPFLILANKQDCENAINEMDLRKYIFLDKLKTLNELEYLVQDTVGITGFNVSQSMKIFEF